MNTLIEQRVERWMTRLPLRKTLYLGTAVDRAWLRHWLALRLAEDDVEQRGYEWGLSNAMAEEQDIRETT